MHKNFIAYFAILLMIFKLNAQLQTKAPWPMFQNNAKHTGSTNKQILSIQSSPTIKWSYNVDGRIESSPTIGYDGTIYITTLNGSFYAITNGNVRWITNVASPIRSSPSIGKDNTIYFGCNNNRLYAVTNGKIKWSYDTGMWIDWSSPVINTNNIVYIGNGNSGNNLYAISNGNLKWNAGIGGNQMNPAPLIGNNGILYAAVGGVFLPNTSSLHAVYATNAAIKWSKNNLGFLLGSPVIGNDNTIYLGSGYRTNQLYAITNGAFKWQFTAGSNINSSPAIDDNNVIYFGCADKYVYAVTNGSLKWKFLTSGTIDMASPAIGKDNTIYIGNMNGDFYAIDQNGIQKWSLSLGGAIQGTGALGLDGTIYIGNTNRKLYAISGSLIFPNTNPTSNQINTLSNENNSLDNIIIVPNPYIRNINDTIVFYNLTKDTEIKIYTITGRIINTLKKFDNDKQYRWDVRDKNGILLPPGVYMCYFTNPQGIKRYKQLVIKR